MWEEKKKGWCACEVSRREWPAAPVWTWLRLENALDYVWRKESMTPFVKWRKEESEVRVTGAAHPKNAGNPMQSKSMLTATVTTATPCARSGGEVWRLKDHVSVWSFGSRVYIRWSDKLGLSIDGRNPERARLLVEQVLAKGTITLELWEKHFYPTWAFGTVTYMDWRLPLPPGNRGLM